MRITRRHITLWHYFPIEGISTFICDFVPDHARKFRVYARGDAAWRAATRHFNQHKP